MNPLDNNFNEVNEFIPLTEQENFTYVNVECPNVKHDMVQAFFNSEGDVVYSPMAIPDGCGE